MITTQTLNNLSYPFDFDGYRVFVIGGGTSLIGFDFSIIEDELKIGANMAAIKAHAQILVSIDRNFIRNYEKEITQFAQDGFAFLGHPIDTNHDRIPSIPEAMNFVRLRGNRLDVPELHLCGTNSGWAAFQMALASHASEVHLLGFDFRLGRHGKHFFGRYRHGSSCDKQTMHNWSKAFEEHANEIARRGTKVINWIGAPPSAIDCFETRYLEDLQEWLSQ